MIAIGKKAPAFSLKGSDGKLHKLSDYAGRKAVIYFYPKDDTPGCTKEACGFRLINKKLLGHNAVVLGVSRDPVESHVDFIKKFKLPFVLLSDPEGKIMEKYGAWGEKVMYGKKTLGV
ncbi:MAG: peroxiredoxin, partial [Bdellovibrionales bacterium]|nr:peroxiredoxin [Bdellovibrionales bacterium]